MLLPDKTLIVKLNESRFLDVLNEFPNARDYLVVIEKFDGLYKGHQKGFKFYNWELINALEHLKVDYSDFQELLNSRELTSIIKLSYNRDKGRSLESIEEQD